MATYQQLLDIASTASGDALRQQLRIAVVVAADSIRVEAPATVGHALRMAWALSAIKSPDSAAREMLWAVLAQNKAFTVAQITGASDSAVQSAVDAAVNLLAGV